MTPTTRYAEACERAAETMTNHCDCDDCVAAVADLRVLARTLREYLPVHKHDGVESSDIVITLPTEPGA